MGNERCFNNPENISKVLNFFLLCFRAVTFYILNHMQMSVAIIKFYVIVYHVIYLWPISDYYLFLVARQKNQDIF